ncbi:oocyte zinc finger protein XlCOF8.4-like [Megalops cyprinoides]|uniref:oocyte zinc finger protein XlCOF8.4-like n=1 Tax=Megalops cyprinoides TaxID=118141 RepID=UPI001864C3AA|nr:oocyte zinc finger protein XlCOF8.4-like [Megalops cyprinoides]
MSNCVSFHAQLASIMEVLAKAAVAEICELVDDGYAVLRLEISRRQKENEALKKKLHMMEMRIARGFIQRPRATESPINGQSGGARVYNESRGTASVQFPVVDDLFCKQPSISLWRDGETTSVNEEQSPMQSIVREESADLDDGVPESPLIKKETLEEDLGNGDPQGALKISEERSIESGTDGGEMVPVADTQTAPAVDTEELTEQNRTRHSVWEDSGLDTALKAEPAINGVNQRLRDTGCEIGAGRLNSLSNEYTLYERPSQLDTFFPQQTSETETESPACSYASKTTSKSRSFHTELQLGPAAAKDASKSLPPLSSLDGMHSRAFEAEADMRSVWNRDPLSGSIYTQCRHNKKDWETEKLHPENVTNIYPPHIQMAPREDTEGSKSKPAALNRYAPCDESLTTSICMNTPRKVGSRERRFICTFCGKSFSSPQNLETHVRVHTGERPFSCAQCGKRFTQSGHLKTHQSVHTGERPFMCTHCGKRFAGKQNLKIHQQRYHPAESVG